MATTIPVRYGRGAEAASLKTNGDRGSRPITRFVTKEIHPKKQGAVGAETRGAGRPAERDRFAFLVPAVERRGPATARPSRSSSRNPTPSGPVSSGSGSDLY